MLSSFKSFFIQLFCFSIGTIGVLLLWQQYASPRFQTNMSWVLWAFFTLVTVFIHMVLVKAAQSSSKKFIVYFITITGLKLFGYLIIILIYALLKREQALGFVILFLVLYFLYSAFEVITLLKYLKK
jgi:hypothetical protein